VSETTPCGFFYNFVDSIISINNSDFSPVNLVRVEAINEGSRFTILVDAFRLGTKTTDSYIDSDSLLQIILKKL
jgi:hypothetical protein